VEVGWTRVGAYAFCRDEGRVLLTRFAFRGHPDDGRWTLPGGGMEWRESPRETAHRELLEETGLTATLGGVAGVFSRWFTAEESVRGSSGHFVGIVLHAAGPRGRLRTEFVADDTTDGVGWFTPRDVRSLPHVELVDFALELVSAMERDATR
jgi:ADP-ribose pyrophosphatase YjhB (NUDIX family)